MEPWALTALLSLWSLTKAVSVQTSNSIIAYCTLCSSSSPISLPSLPSLFLPTTSFLTSTWTSDWATSLQQYLHNHHTHMATSLCPQWGDHHVSGDLLLQWTSEHNHTPSDNNRTGAQDHLYLLCHWLHHHRTWDTTTSTDQYCSYT